MSKFNQVLLDLSIGLSVIYSLCIFSSLTSFIYDKPTLNATYSTVSYSKDRQVAKLNRSHNEEISRHLEELE